MYGQRNAHHPNFNIRKRLGQVTIWCGCGFRVTCDSMKEAVDAFDEHAEESQDE